MTISAAGQANASPAHEPWSLRDVLNVVDHLPAMVAYWDEDLLNRFANTAYVEWFGKSPDQMRGMHIRELLGERLYALNLPYIEGALRGEPQLFDRTIVDSHGVARHTQAQYIPNLVGGKPQGFFVLVADISERVRAERQVLAREAEIARMNERHRIAEDLHDVVIQRLYAVGLDLAGVTKTIPEEAAARVEAALDGIQDAMSELRAAISSMTQGVRSDDIEDWLSRRVRDVARVTGVTPQISIAGSTHDIPDELRGDTLAVLNEALSNVTKHAAAQWIEGRIEIGPEALTLELQDDGRGPGQVQRSSGLANMRARAERRGGTFSIGPREPRGTVLRWTVPLTPAPES